jgi:hypothetical protein
MTPRPTVRRLSAALALASAAGVLGAAGIAGAAAASTTSTAAPVTARTPHDGLRHWLADHRHAVRRAIVSTSAKVIGIQPAALVADLRAGSSISQVATQHGVDPSKVSSALVALGTARVDAALSAHRITAARAADVEAKLPALAQRIITHQFGRHAGSPTPSAG